MRFAIIVLACAAAIPGVAGAERFDIAITVDDLPAHGRLPPGMTRLSIVKTHIAAFQVHGVRQVYGFVNAAKIIDAETNAVLDTWRAAGHPLANHTSSHLNLERAETLEAWTADVAAGEPAVSKRMQGQDWRYLRFPNLAAGTRPDRHDGAANWLASQGYKVASVSMAFDDWSYSDAYARCLTVGDEESIKLMEDQYLLGVSDGIERMKTVSIRVYGRVIPQVLLTHIGGWSAHMLPQVLDRLDAAGAHYVTLQQAQSDVAYANAEGLLGGGGVMERTARARNINITDATPARERIDPKSLCR